MTKNSDEIKKKVKKKKKIKKNISANIIKEKKESTISKMISALIGIFKKKNNSKIENNDKNFSKKELGKKQDISKNKTKKDENNKDKITESNDFIDDLFKDFDEMNEEKSSNSKKKDNQKKKNNNDEKDNEFDGNSDEDYDNESDSIIEDKLEDENPKFLEKFSKKDNVRKPKSLKEIAEESRKKSDELRGQKFTDTDAAKSDLKKTEEGYNTVVKKDVTKKALKGKIFLIRGKDNGRPAWHYILVPPENIKALRKQKAGSNIDVTDYGRIVRSGWGENPSEEIVKEVEAEYGD